MLQRIIFWAFGFYLLTSFISISASQIFLGLSLVAALIFWISRKTWPRWPAFFWALLVYMALSLVAAYFSHSPATSFRDSRELLLYLIVPLTLAALSSLEKSIWANRLLLISAGANLLFSFFYFFFQASPGERIRGFMGHYMTEAGLLLLFSCLALSLFCFLQSQERIIWGVAFGLTAIALLLTQTRSAWLGLLVGAAIVIYYYRPQLLLILPLLIVLIFVISPSPIKKRALSIFSTKSYSNRIRLEYLRAGIQIIKEYPLFGTGPDTVDVVFKNPKYGLSKEARENVHLHNNLTQIAAERGLPALAAWLIFLGLAFWELLKLLQHRAPSRLFPQAVAGISILLAFFIAGLFEYNFGDSEVVTLFLCLITWPFALNQSLQKNTPYHLEKPQP
ncbi:MAG: O-antigen ligase family protein [Candidatus Aminicenantes bacterium]|nr:O-antigen ligase family protein [Candidatus Aminicenantes bacterium]